MKKTTPKKCKLWFCTRTAVCKGLCHSHYQNTLRYGVPVSPNNIDAVALINATQRHIDTMGLYSPEERISNSELYRSLFEFESRAK